MENRFGKNGAKEFGKWEILNKVFRCYGGGRETRSSIGVFLKREGERERESAGGNDLGHSQTVIFSPCALPEGIK